VGGLETSTLIFYVVVMLASAKLLEIPFRWLNLNPIPAYVLAGFIIGPYVLGIIEFYLELTSIAYLGLILLMLYTGLTTEFREIKSNFKEVVAMGSLGIIVTFIAVYTYLWLLGFPSIISLFIAVALSNTATETVAGVLARSGESKLRSLVIGASFFDDIIAVYLITLLTGFGLRELSIEDLLAFTAKTVAFIAIAFYISSLFSSKYTRIYQYMSKNYFWFASSVVLIALVLALIARMVGLSELLGAYLAGVIISRSREFHDPMLRTRIALTNFISDFAVILDVIFIPIFFVYVGLSYSIREVDVILYASLLTLAMIGKFIGVYPYAYAVFRDRSSAIAAGILMGSRGSLDIALLRLGLEAELIDQTVFSTVLTVALTTTILTPLIYTIVYKGKAV